MSNKLQLYKHQEKFVKNIRKQFRKGKKHVLAQSPTGSGKTVMFSSMAADTINNGKKVLILTDRIELLTQAGGTLSKFGMTPSYINADVRFLDRKKSLYVAMSQTLRRRLTNKVWRNFIQKSIDLIIIDEAHKQEFNYLFEDGFLDGKFVIGFSATPSRAGKMVQLGDQYDTMVKGKPIKWFIKKGFLLNCDVYDCGSPDMSGVTINKAKGDFSEKSMFSKFDSPQLYKGLVKNYSRICPNKKMMVFCCNIEHAIKTTKQLKKAGYNAKFVAAKKSPPRAPREWNDATKAVYDEKFRAYKVYMKNYDKHSGNREDVFDWFKKSKDGILVNIDIATTGFDDQTVEVVALYRATASVNLYYQMIGRAARTVKDGSMVKTHFITLDFGGNKSRFGPYDSDYPWGLWHDEVKPGGGTPPLKTCGENSDEQEIDGAGKIKKGCKRLIPASVKICTKCGFKYPEKNKAKDAELALSSITDENGVSLKTKAFKDMSFEELTEYRRIKEHHIFWLYRALWYRNGAETIKEYGKQYGWPRKRFYFVITNCTTKFGTIESIKKKNQ